MSLLVDVSEAESFSKGEIIEKCTLFFNRVKYSIPDVKVVGMWKVVVDKEPKVKLGIAFLGMKEKVTERLCVQINSEARGEEILKQLVAKKKIRVSFP